MSTFDFALTLASLAACFWLGYQLGTGQAKKRRRREVEDFERRFKIVNGEAVEVPNAQWNPHFQAKY